jgi:hypothetical protein
MIPPAVAPMWPTAMFRQLPEPADDVGTHATAEQGEAARMDQRSTKVSALLHEAAETHHQVFRITDGADDDWASWYADWLVTLSELPELLGAKSSAASSPTCWSAWTRSTPSAARLNAGRTTTLAS